MDTPRKPTIRFKGFEEEWEGKKLDEITVRSSSIRSDDKLPRVEYEDIVSEAGLLNKNVYTKQSSKAGIFFRSGDVLYGKLRPYLHNWFLPVFDGLAVGDFWVLQPHNVDSGFLYRLIQSRQFDDVANQSTGTKMPRADWKLVSQTQFALPSQMEQGAIGAFFARLDALIALHQRKYEKLQVVKKAMLEKMFPQNGSTVPEIRFHGFVDEWKQRKISDIADIVGGGTPDTSNPAYWDGDIDWYAPAEMGDKIYADSSERKITALGFQECSAKMLPANKTILFTSRAGIGKTAILRHSACTNQGFQSLVLRDGIAPYFVYSMSNQLKAKAEAVASGSTFAEISGKMLGNLDVILPSLAEQEAIGAFFAQLDRLIALHQGELGKLRNIRQALLEKMFV